MNEKSMRGGFIVVILLILMQCASMIPYLMPSMMMADMAGDLGVGYTYLGLTITIIMVSGGICMFVASFIQKRFGYWNTMVVSMFALVIGNLLSTVTYTNPVGFMIARILIGAGYGFSNNCANPLISYWFKGKTQSIIITVNMIACSAGMAIAYQVPIWFGGVMGHWNRLFILTTVLAVIAAVLWLLFGKVLKAGDIGKAPASELSAKGSAKDAPLLKAFKVKAFWFFAIIGICTSSLSILNGSYLPTILMTERGFSDVFAASVGSMNTLCAIIGSLVIGALVTATGKKKPWYLLCLGLMVITAMSVVTLSNGTGILIMNMIFGAVGMGIYSAQSPLIIETQDDYSILGAAFAMCSGFGLLVEIAAPSLFTKLAGAFGSMAASYRVMCIGYIVAFVIALFFIKERKASGKE